MGVAIINSYLVLLFLLVHFGIVRFNLFWKLSPFIVIVLVLFGLLIPMGWGAPQGSAVVARNSVAIVPDVAGEVLDVPVVANTPLKSGDVLFRIDPVPYDVQVKAIEAQLKLSATRLAQMTQLFERDSGRGFDVEQRQLEVDQLKAQLEGAKWNLDKTTVARPGRRLRHQPRAAQGRAGRQLAADAGDGFHRHVRYHHRRRDRPERCPLYRAGTGGRGHLQVRAGACL
jgi:multidrug efflux pump subunit AcrA (membrane-fusion protein)